MGWKSPLIIGTFGARRCNELIFCTDLHEAVLYRIEEVLAAANCAGPWNCSLSGGALKSKRVSLATFLFCFANYLFWNCGFVHLKRRCAGNLKAFWLRQFLMTVHHLLWLCWKCGKQNKLVFRRLYVQSSTLSGSLLHPVYLLLNDDSCIGSDCSVVGPLPHAQHQPPQVHLYQAAMRQRHNCIIILNWALMYQTAPLTLRLLQQP